MAHIWLCGTPTGFCSGGRYILGDDTDIRGHSSSTEAFKCYSSYLTNILGWKRVGAREFKRADNGRIEVLSKKSHFGTRLMGGKRGGETGNKTKRYVPDTPSRRGWIG